MKKISRNRFLRITLLTGFVMTILLLTIRHYYEAATFNTVSSGGQSVIQTIAVLNNTIELTLELGYEPDSQLPDTTTRLIYRNNRAARNTAAIRPLLDSLVLLTRQAPELQPLARQLQTEAETVFKTGVNEGGSSGVAIQRLVRLLRTFRLALADNLLDNQKRINEHITTMRRLDNTIDALVLLLASALLYVFYRYTLRRERLTKQVLDRQKELTQYLEAIPEGVVVLNTDNQIVYVNQAAQEFLSISETNIPMALSDWAALFQLSQADSKTALAPADLPLSRALQGETATKDILALETQDGTRLLSAHARPLYGRQGELVGAISIFSDITEANQKEQELQRARTIAEQSLQEREIFLANISHDIRTPLNAILGFSELLRQSPSPADEQDYLNGIRLSGNNLLALINDLLDISRIESGQLVLDPVPTSTQEIWQTVEATLAAKASRKGLSYEVQIDESVPPMVIADPVRLTQILLNFSDNAVKFTKGGFVKLAISTEANDDPERATLLMRVEDSGVGIAEKDLSGIFDRFSRVSEDTLFRSAGTGLGLNIAHNLISLMGGTVSVESRLGQGSLFTIRIPLQIPETINTPVLQPIPVPPTKHRSTQADTTVLIVEDNEMNQKVVRGFLSRYQLQSVVANNGLEAVKLLQEQAVDLILMDIQMPEMDGYTATQTIRQQLRLDTPIVAMTAYTMPGERERCLLVGMNAYLTKPVRMEQLDEMLAQFAPRALLKNTLAVNGRTVVESRKDAVNLIYLEEITGGDNELLSELVALFTRDLPDYRQTLFESIENNDRATFDRTAHKFRSSLNSLAMLDTAEALKKLEGEDQAMTFDVGIQLARLFQDINRGLLQLEKLVARNTPR